METQNTNTATVKYNSYNWEEVATWEEAYCAVVTVNNMTRNNCIECYNNLLSKAREIVATHDRATCDIYDVIKHEVEQGVEHIQLVITKA